MKIWNLNVKRGADGSKHLDIQMHGVIDGGWFDEAGIDSAACIAELQQHLDAKTIGVRINSIGGSAFGGVAMYNALQSHPGEVTCTVEGLAASAASLVAMAGKCVMGTGSMMMIHKPAAMAMGNADELRKTADVLDKMQDALASVYTVKTGKSLDEINDLLDDETYMNAAEAVAAGFADEVMPDSKTDYGPGEQVPADQDPDADDDEPMLTESGVIWAGVTFPVKALPQQIIAMAKAPAPPVVAAAVVTTADTSTPPAVAPVLALVPTPPPEPPLARVDLERRAPELLAALIEEGRATGAAAERARLQAIDELGIVGAADLVVAAKYGDKPTDAPTLAMAVIKAGKHAGSELLAMRRSESNPLVAVATGAPDQTAAAAEARQIKQIVDGINERRGGSR